MLDLLLTNARIVDGTGNPWRKGCVGVRDGRIVAVGSAHDMPEARTVLDIGGKKYVAVREHSRKHQAIT